jgi:plastocyanin/mono/diheme cytochrome c family protein
MNTSKQINVMILLIFLLLIALGAYTLFDPTRQQDARAEQTDLLAQRGAALFVTNCRPCHGDVGQGRVGPALNRPDLRDPAKRDQLQSFVHDTINCGRVGTLMPTWGQPEGGPLDEEQMRGLVTLITVDPNDAWNTYVKPLSEAANQIATPAAVADLLKGSLTGSSDSVCGQKVASASTAPPATPGTPSTSLTETATDNQFATTSFTVPAGQAVTLQFTNQGNAIHNWHVTDAKDANGQDITTGPNGVLGGQSANVTFTITTAGTYHFQCDFHPTEMLGTLFVVGPGGAGAAPAAAATPAPGAIPGTTPLAAPSTTPGAGASPAASPASSGAGATTSVTPTPTRAP